MKEVDYISNKYGAEIELSGVLIPYNTGRTTDYRFEPNWFKDEVSENIFAENWEEIEEEIKNENL